MDAPAVNCRKKPCAECPWVRSTPPGQFPAERYDALRATTGSPGREAWIDAALFACHMSTEVDPIPCAGWLASVGYYSLRVRILLADGTIPREAMTPGPEWPDLFDSYEEMAEAQSG